MLVGSLLALMAFLLAVTMGMAVGPLRLAPPAGARGGQRHRHGLPAGGLPAAAGVATRPASCCASTCRCASTPPTRSSSRANFARSAQIQAQLWAIVEPLARSTPDSQVLALYISALNDMIDLGETRLTAIVYARVPETIVWLLFLGAALTLGMVGFHAGLHRRRSLIGAVVLVIVLGAVITLVVDLDRPRRRLPAGEPAAAHRRPAADRPALELSSPPPACQHRDRRRNPAARTRYTRRHGGRALR